MKTENPPSSTVAAGTLAKRQRSVQRTKELALLFWPQIAIALAALLLAWLAPDEASLSENVQTADNVTWWFGLAIVVGLCVSSSWNEHLRHPHSKAVFIPLFTAIERTAWIYVAAKLICALHGMVDEAIEKVVGNPGLSVSVVFGGSTAVYVLALWRHANSKYVRGNYSPYAELITPQDIDPFAMRHTAIHEAGHTLFYAAMSPLPEGLTACVARKLGADDTMAGYVSSGYSEPQNMSMQYLELRMLRALAGCEAEYVVYSEQGLGGEADYDSWQEDATTWLSHGCGEHYYRNAKSEAERASNRDVLTRLKYSHIAIVRAFLRHNEEVLKDLAKEFSEHECLDLAQLQPFLDRVDLNGHDGIPRLKRA